MRKQDQESQVQENQNSSIPSSRFAKNQSVSVAPTPHNLPWQVVGRVTHCVIENLEVIGTPDYAPEAYVGGCHANYIVNAVNSHAALYEVAKESLAFLKVLETFTDDMTEGRRDAFHAMQKQLGDAIRLANTQRANTAVSAGTTDQG